MNEATQIFSSLAPPAAPVLDRLRQWVHIKMCGVSGHTLYRDTSDRTVLRERCTCGYTTRGIDIGGHHYHLRFSGDKARLRL